MIKFGLREYFALLFEGYSKRKEFAPRGSKVILLRVASFEKVVKYFNAIVIAHEGMSIPFKKVSKQSRFNKR